MTQVPDDTSDIIQRIDDLHAEIKYLRDFRDNAVLPMYSMNAECKPFASVCVLLAYPASINACRQDTLGK